VLQGLRKNPCWYPRPWWCNNWWQRKFIILLVSVKMQQLS